MVKNLPVNTYNTLIHFLTVLLHFTILTYACNKICRHICTWHPFWDLLIYTYTVIWLNGRDCDCETIPFQVGFGASVHHMWTWLCQNLYWPQGTFKSWWNSLVIPLMITNDLEQTNETIRPLACAFVVAEHSNRPVCTAWLTELTSQEQLKSAEIVFYSVLPP